MEAIALTNHDLEIEDIEYVRHGDKPLLLRLFKPAGAGPFPLILMFAEDRAALVAGLSVCKAKLEVGGALWVAYAKGTSSKATDINRDSIREYVATVGLDTVAQIAIDADWSALRLKVV